MDFITALIFWFLVSVPLALLAARFIRFGEGDKS